MNDLRTPATRGSQNGPPLLIPAVVLAVLAGLAAVLGAPGPRPGSTAATVLAYQLGHHGRLDVLATVLFGSSVPLAIWAATAYHRLLRLGVRAPGAAMAFAGGLLGAGSLAVSGLVTWTAAQTADRTSPSPARTLDVLAFATGGPGFVVPLALLLAGVAVPVLILRLLPRWLGWAGLVVAVLGMLATLTLLTPALYLLLPLVRFGGLLWIVAVSVLLPHDRSGASDRESR